MSKLVVCGPLLYARSSTRAAHRTGDRRHAQIPDTRDDRRAGWRRRRGRRSAQSGPARRLSRAELENKIRGGWAGQMIGVLVRRADGVRVEPAHHSLADHLEAGRRHQLDQAGRSLRRDDVRRGARQGRPRRHDRAVRRDVQELEVHAVARQRLGAPPAESRHQGAVVRAPEVQRPRQRHRLPDRVGLHRADDAGAAAGGQLDRRSRRPRHELRRRALRRHVLQRDVRCGVLRDRSAQGRRSRAGVDSRRQRLRQDHPRRARLVGHANRTGRRPGASSPTNGIATTCARTAR